MLDPKDREIFACRTCRDFRHVYAGKQTIDCPECAGWDEGKRAELLRQATRERAEKPSIRMSDLSDEERALVAEWTMAHPTTNQLTFLTWIEGRRYDPAKDPEFIADARKAFKKWKFLRNAGDGPLPDWAKTALATGHVNHLSKDDREYVESLRGQK